MNKSAKSSRVRRPEVAVHYQRTMYAYPCDAGNLKSMLPELISGTVCSFDLSRCRGR